MFQVDQGHVWRKIFDPIIFRLAWIGIVTSLVMEKIQSANRLAIKKDSQPEPDPVVIIENFTQC